MQEADLLKIEQSLQLALPADYRKVMLDYPLSRFFGASEWKLIDDPDRLIRENAFLQKEGFWGRGWSPSFFCFSLDGMGNGSYFDLDCVGSAVYTSNDESSDELEYASFLDWLHDTVLALEEQEEKIDENRAARQSKKWWQFWI